MAASRVFTSSVSVTSESCHLRRSTASPQKSWLPCVLLLLAITPLGHAQAPAVVPPSLGPWAIEGSFWSGATGWLHYCGLGETVEEAATAMFDWSASHLPPPDPYILESCTVQYKGLTHIDTGPLGLTCNTQPSAIVGAARCRGVKASGSIQDLASFERHISCPSNYKIVFDGQNYGCEARADDTCPIANPVSGATGAKFHEEIDYTSHGFHPLSFRRYYNGAGYYSPGYAPELSRVGGFSRRWSHSYATRLYPALSGALRAGVLRPSGELWIFDLNGVEVINAGGRGGSSRLVQLPNGNWQLTLPTLDKEIFDSTGKLISMVTQGGLHTNLSYDLMGRLSTVQDSFGRSLSFGYDSEGRLANLTDPSGSTITYSYDGNGWKENVVRVTYQDMSFKVYHYDTEARLVGITDEVNNRYSTYTYDYYGRVTVSEHGSGAERYEFTYNATIDYAYSTQIKDPLGTVRTVTTGYLANAYRTTSATGGPSDSCGSDAARSYDSNGNVAERTDFRGFKTKYAYDLLRNLETSRTEGFGTPKAKTTTTLWHTDFRVPVQVDEPGRSTVYTHDAASNILTRTVTDTVTGDSRSWGYTYNAFAQVLTIDGPRIDAPDITTIEYYNCATGYQCGQVNTITNALGHVTAYNTYNAHGQPLTITDPNGVVTTLTYDLRQRLTSRTVGAEVTTFDYWPTGLLKKATLPDGSYLEYIYDAAHRLTDIEDAEGNRIHYTLDGIGNRTGEEVRDPSGLLSNTRTRVFNTLNQLWKEVGAAGTPEVTTEYGYDANGNPIDVDAPLNRGGTKSYDELNRLSSFTDPLSGTTSYGYNALDQLISVTDPRSKVTSYAYNALDDLKQLVSPDTGTTNYSYDAAGNLLIRTDARSKTGTYTYDALNRVIGLTYPDQTISYTYDQGTNGKGQLTSLSDASGSTTWTYDSNGRITSRHQSVGGLSFSVGYGYTFAGLLDTLTLPSGNAIAYGYANGKVTSLTLNGGTTLLSNVLYQPFGSTTGWTWGNSTLAVREYDTDGRVTAIDSAGLATYAYDDASRIASVTTDGGSQPTQIYTYDKLDRLTDVLEEAPEPLSVALSATSGVPGATVSATISGIPPGSGYWLALARVTDPQTAYKQWIAVTPVNGEFVWNVVLPTYAGTYQVRLFGGGFNQLLSSDTITVSAPPAPTQPTLNASVGTTIPGASVTVRLAGGPGGASDWMTLSKVGTGNNYLQYVFVGGGVSNREWTVSMPTTAASYEFRLYLNGAFTLAARSTPIVVKTAAPVSGTGPQSSNYAYDQNGNRLSGDGSIFTVSSSNNRLVSVAGTLSRSYVYDPAGNVLSDGARTFTYDDRGRMISATKAGITTTYTLNALGQRVRKISNAASNYFVYDEAGHLIGEYDSSGNMIQETAWLGDVPVAVLKPNGSGGVNVFYVHTDHLNTPRRISRPSDNMVVWRWDSDPFGTTAADENPDGDSTLFSYNLRFPGQYADLETGLHYNYFRDYDPQTGRYMQSDPTGLTGGINTFAYVEGDPIGSDDDDGLRRRNRARERSLRGPTLIEPRGTGGALTRVDLSNGSQCGVCLDIFYIARVQNRSRAGDRTEANQQYYAYVNGPTGPNRIDGRPFSSVLRDMRGPSGLRNPPGFEWHHPMGRPNEVWLVRRCDHRDPTLRPYLHGREGGRGGWAEYGGF